MEVISIIIPINKRFDLLKNQIDSLSKNYYVLEIIVVLNNADMTISEVNKMFENYHKVRILECKTGYANSARKHGVDNANGKYIVFSDADDYYENQGLKILLEEINQGFDFVQGEIGLVRDGNLKNWHRPIPNTTLSNRKDILKNSKIIRPNFYGKIFRKSAMIPSDKVFLDLKITQDWNAVYKLCYNFNSAKIIRTRVYIHVVHPDTITQNKDLQNYYLTESSRGLRDLLNFCDCNGAGLKEEKAYSKEIMLRFLVNTIRVCLLNGIDYRSLKLSSYNLTINNWRAMYLYWMRFKLLFK